jgi:hypothetical protein
VSARVVADELLEAALSAHASGGGVREKLAAERRSESASHRKVVIGSWKGTLPAELFMNKVIVAFVLVLTVLAQPALARGGAHLALSDRTVLRV